MFIVRGSKNVAMSEVNDIKDSNVHDHQSKKEIIFGPLKVFPDVLRCLEVLLHQGVLP